MANVPMLELKDKDGNLFYPITKVEAVLDDNGNNIDDYIDDKVAGKTGHQILDDEGTAVAQKSKLQFENATVENVGDKTVVTPLSGVTTEPFQTAQGTTAVPMVNSFNGRQGTVTPTNGDYTADMVGAIPVQSGTQGQVLGFVSDNVIGAVDPVSGGVTSFNSRTGDITPAQGDYSIEQISATGTRGQVIGLTADNTIGVMNAPEPTYTGTAGQVLGFTATDTVGAINPPQPTYTGSQGQLLGFTDVNTVGAVNGLSNYTGDINITGNYKINGNAIGQIINAANNGVPETINANVTSAGFAPSISFGVGTWLVIYSIEFPDATNLDVARISIGNRYATVAGVSRMEGNGTYGACVCDIVTHVNSYDIFNAYNLISSKSTGTLTYKQYVTAIRIA